MAINYNLNDSKEMGDLSNFDQYSHNSQMSHLSSQIVAESGTEVDSFTKKQRSMKKAGKGNWKRNQQHVKITQGILKTSSTGPLYQQLGQVGRTG